MSKKVLLFLLAMLFVMIVVYAAAPPTRPVASMPLNQTALNYIPEFSWVNSSDADGDAITYILEFAADSGFINMVAAANTTTLSNSTTPVLPSEGIFYWHVIATDGALNSSASEAMQFVYDFTAPIITNETNTPNPSFNASDVALTSIISDNLNENATISMVWIETNYTGLLANYSAAKNLDGVYSYFIDDRNFTTNQSISYRFYANDSAGNEAAGSWNNFAVNGTLLFINPALPNGLNDWYTTNPSIELKTNRDGYINYKWDELVPLVYTGQFSASQVLPIGGKQIIKYWSSDIANSTIEPQKNFTLKLDVTNPRIISTYPINNSLISNVNPLISARMDDIYFDNSQINKSTIMLVFDDYLINHSVSGNSTVNITYLASNISNGMHNVSVTAIDYAGNTGSYKWTFGIDLSPISLSINNPANTSYNDGSLIVNISTSKNADIYKSLDNSSYLKLCSSCQDFQKIFSFSEGSHFFSVKAVNGASMEDIKNVSFFIDTIMPQVISTIPEKSEFVSEGNFSIIYKEINLKSITLNYRPNTSSGYSNVSLACIPSKDAKTQQCSTLLNLTGFNGLGLEYYFELSDGLNEINSSRINFDADTAIPSIIINSPAASSNYSKKQILLDISANELATLSYIDNETEIALCRNCKSFNNTKSFKDGLHNFTLIATDKAGNRNSDNFNIFIDSKIPKIRKISPSANGFSNGNFTVQYTESNLSKVILYYKNQTSVLNQVMVNSCISGTNQDCSAIVNLTGYEGQIISFLFNISDSSREATSKINSVTIDTIKPGLNVISPINTTYISVNNLLLNMTTTETARISYSDNGSDFKNLCSACTKLKTNKFFADGSHNLLIKAIDPAGNTELKTVDFTVQ